MARRIAFVASTAVPSRAAYMYPSYLISVIAEIDSHLADADMRTHASRWLDKDADTLGAKMLSIVLTMK